MLAAVFGTAQELKRSEKSLRDWALDGSFGKEKLLEQCESYLNLFGIPKNDLISVSYSDLLLVS